MERWDFESTNPIIAMENEGTLTRVPGLSSPRYSLEEVEKIESIEKRNPLSPLERRRMERRIQEQDKEINLLKDKINSIKAVLS